MTSYPAELSCLLQIIEAVSGDVQILQDMYPAGQHIYELARIIGKGDCLFPFGKIEHADDFLPLEVPPDGQQTVYIRLCWTNAL